MIRLPWTSTPRKSRFLVFSRARCGSTNLARILDCHPRVSCILEPFNPGFAPGLQARPASIAELDRVLAGIWRGHDGIKHVWQFTGWPFAHDSGLNRALLLRAAPRVIFLTRRNLLRQAVSDQLALQTQLFNLSDDDDIDPEGLEYAPLDDEAIAAELARGREVTGAHFRALREADIPFVDLAYEDLYDPNNDIPARRRVVDSLLAFLGRDPRDPEIDEDRVAALLDPERQRVNSRDTLGRVPGIERIEARFGSDETGWLFRPGDLGSPAGG